MLLLILHKIIYCKRCNASDHGICPYGNTRIVSAVNLQFCVAFVFHVNCVLNLSDRRSRFYCAPKNYRHCRCHSSAYSSCIVCACLYDVTVIKIAVVIFASAKFGRFKSCSEFDSLYGRYCKYYRGYCILSLRRQSQAPLRLFQFQQSFSLFL